MADGDPQPPGPPRPGPPRPGPPSPERREHIERIVALLARWELGCTYHLRAAADRAPLSLNEFLVLAEICARSDGATGAKVADVVGIGTGGVTGILARLEEQELVYRDTDPRDRRQIVATASDAGRALVRDDLVEPADRGFGALLHELRPDQLRVLVWFLDRVTDLAYRRSHELRELPRLRFVDELPPPPPPTRAPRPHR